MGYGPQGRKEADMVEATECVRAHTHTHPGPTWKLCSKPTIEINTFKAARGKDTLSTEE